MPPIAAYIRRNADSLKSGLLFEDESYSHAEVVARACQRAAFLLGQRTTAPFHVGVLLDNVPEAIFWLEAAGLVLKHNFEGSQAVYELDHGQHHDHMVDVESGKVIEFTSPEIEMLQKQIAEKHGYVIEDHSLVLYVRPKKSAKQGHREGHGHGHGHGRS